MRGLRVLAGVLVAAGVAMALPAIAQQPENAPSPAPLPPNAEQIRRMVETVKKGRTLPIVPADGMEDTEGETVLRVDNPSPFPMTVFLLGPTVQSMNVGAEQMQTLTLEPGAYEIAVTVNGRDLPPFYGKQTIVANMRYIHKFIVPAY